jgi:hypothetical protein
MTLNLTVASATETHAADSCMACLPKMLGKFHDRLIYTPAGES